MNLYKIFRCVVNGKYINISFSDEHQISGHIVFPYTKEKQEFFTRVADNMTDLSIEQIFSEIHK